MTRILAKDLYEWPMHNETATCEDCGAEIVVPDIDDVNADMKAPHWRREEHWEPFEDIYEALCDECYAEGISEILAGGDER